MANKLDRRTLLKSAAASLALPFMPSLGLANPSTEAPKRLCVVFFGIGVALPPEGHAAHQNLHWYPHQTGSDYKLNDPLSPLASMREHFSILGGLSHPRTRHLYSHSTGAYYLTGAEPDTSTGNTVSLDQFYAQFAGDKTRYPYLNMGSEGGIGDFRLPNTLAYSLSGQPIPSIGTPRAVYDELFGVRQGGATMARRNFGRDRSILDSVLPDLSALNNRVNPHDKQRLEQYLSAVRQLEQRVERAEAWLEVERPKVPQENFNLDVDPVTDGPEAFIDSMYDMIHTAFVTDSTRIATYMKVKEAAGGLAAKFPQVALGLPSHHALSHNFESEGGFERWAQYDKFLSQRFARFINKMATTEDPIGEGSLLDNTIVLYGSGTSNTHNPRNFPTIVAGGHNMGFKHGSYHRFDESVPFSNLFSTFLQQLGAPTINFADSTGIISDILA